jgi:hypothetical protein
VVVDLDMDLDVDLDVDVVSTVAERLVRTAHGASKSGDHVQV